MVVRPISQQARGGACEALSFELARNHQIRVHVLCPCIVASALDKTSVVNQRVQENPPQMRWKPSVLAAFAWL